jgi:ribonuclease-3 family protein
MEKSVTTPPPSAAPLQGGEFFRCSPAELAYLGDAVFELLVRDMLMREGVPFRDMFRRAKGYVSAKAQAEMYHRIFPELPPEEQAILKRGRNLHANSRAKSANVSEYRHSTGLETLFGHLHQNGDFARIAEIFALCVYPSSEKATLEGNENNDV